jgi:hypothetical protein
MNIRSRDHDPSSFRTSPVFDVPKPPWWVWVSLSALVVILWGIDFLSGDHHMEIRWQSTPLFFFGYGVLSCLGLVLVAKVAAIFLKRNEDEYD